VLRRRSPAVRFPATRYGNRFPWPVSVFPESGWLDCVPFLGEDECCVDSVGGTVDTLDLEFERADVFWEGRRVLQGAVLAELAVGHIVSRSHPGRVTRLGSCWEGVQGE